MTGVIVKIEHTKTLLKFQVCDFFEREREKEREVKGAFKARGW